jgi:uncharacterized membrane protein HdeD (DUF308 family)
MRPLKPLASLDLAARRHGAVLLVRGIASVVFGACALLWPGVTLAGVMALFAVYCAADGIAAFTGGYATHFWESIASGTISLMATLTALLVPRATADIVVYVVAGWAMARGIFELALAIEFRRVIDGEWRMALEGFLSVALGVLIALNPAVGALWLAWLLGTYALVFGACLIALGLRVRRPIRQGHRT